MTQQLNKRPPTKTEEIMQEPNVMKRFLKTLGPGLVTGASDDDPSGIGTYAVAGEQAIATHQKPKIGRRITAFSVQDVTTAAGISVGTLINRERRIIPGLNRTFRSGIQRWAGGTSQGFPLICEPNTGFLSVYRP